MNDKDRKKDYEKSANEYWRWVNSGDDLLIAARILEVSYKGALEKIKKNQGKLPLAGQILSQMIYLKAESIELYLKALYIKQGNQVIKNGRLVKEFGSHNLFSLCTKTGIKTSKNELVLLTKLAESITFWGRYPIPKYFTKWRLNVEGVQGVQPIYVWSEDDNLLLENILKKVADIIDIKNDKSVPWNHF